MGDKQGNHHEHSSVQELRRMSDTQLVEEVASEDETHRLQSEAELQRRLSERVAKLNRTMLFMTGIMFLMDLALLGLAYVWLRPRVEAADAWKRAAGSIDLKDARRRAGSLVEEAGELVGTALETAGQSLQIAGSGLGAAGHGLAAAEKVAERQLRQAGKKVSVLR